MPEPTEVQIPVTARQAEAIQTLQANVQTAQRELTLYVTAIVAGTEHEKVELLALESQRNGSPAFLRVRVLDQARPALVTPPAGGAP